MLVTLQQMQQNQQYAPKLLIRLSLKNQQMQQTQQQMQQTQLYRA